MNSLYDFPAAYDAVMGRPNEVVETEVRTVEGLLARYEIPGRKILELACGACAHGIRLAAHGFQVTGIDRSAAMLDEAQRRARAAGVNLRTVQGDVVAFDLGVADFDAALFLFETFPLITDYRDIVSHFRAVRRHMKSGGIYIVDLDASRGVREQAGEWGRKIIPLPDGQVEMWHEDSPGDWVNGINHLVLVCRISLHGKDHATRDEWHIRAYSPWQVSLLAQTLDGWRLGGFYSWQDLSKEIANERHYFTVFVAE
jgi:ubiquinone/menaquinone biosynthesis C-methylase UbiE